jgi:molybdopterin-containing oxidoreductase family iron-sulfur binding subunit
MDKGRRGFLKAAGASLLGLGLGAPVVATRVKGSGSETAARPASGTRWAMVVDTRRCLEEGGCRACIDACHAAHNVPEMEDLQHEVKWVWKEPYGDAFPTQVHPYTEETLRSRPTLVLCNHCERPPCVRVCPTQATFKNDDGIVAMDQHRCIGCRYCLAACPYGARSFNWTDPRPFIREIHDDFPTRTKGVVEKCNLCAERLARGELPACVEACRRVAGPGAIVFGDLADPESEVSNLLRTTNTIRRKPSLGTAPHVFYVV